MVKEGHAVVSRCARSPGTMLLGTCVLALLVIQSVARPASSQDADPSARINALETQVANLQTQVAEVEARLGVSPTSAAQPAPSPAASCGDPSSTAVQVAEAFLRAAVDQDLSRAQECFAP